MHCPKCGTENPSHRRFCGECGTALSARCPMCGKENGYPFRFCGYCGASLSENRALHSSWSNRPGSAISFALEQTNVSATVRASDGERKTVSALFADIHGSMELMEDLDPEEARAMVDPAIELMIQAVSRYDGYIVQSTGDGIFALFGAPLAREDHPQRALYAALAMQEELKSYSDRLRGEGRQAIEVRIGVHTGQVVVRSIKTSIAQTEYTPIGHSISLASRMQALAPIGSIATTEQVEKLCRGYFLFRSLGPTKVKGVSDPLEIFEVTGVGRLRTRLQLSAGRGFTRFVGRSRELEEIKTAANRVANGQGQMVALIADAGTGKSRLLFEFKSSLPSNWTVLEAFSVSHGKLSAYLPVIDLLHGFFNIFHEDEARKRREKVALKLSSLDPSLEHTLPYLLGLLGIGEGDDPLSHMDPETKRKRSLDAIRRILIRASQDQPIVLIFEDLHWVDAETQTLLNLLADSLAATTILLLLSYRPEYHHEWSSKAYYTQLRLDSLSTGFADEMLSALLGDEAELAPLKHLIVERTEGNPFFIEETVQLMFDEGALVRDGSVKLTRPLGELKLPSSVQAILASRIDSLSISHKELLQTLAVIGKEFPLALVRALTQIPIDELHTILLKLQSEEFIYERPAASDIEFVFKHALTQEVAYESVLNERRKILHEHIGVAIETLYADSLGDHLSQLAHHYGHSSNNGKAVKYLALAAKRELAQSAYQGALRHLLSAMDLIPSSPESRERSQQELDLRLDHGHALIAINGWHVPEVGSGYLRARDLCQSLGLAADTRLFSVVYGLFCHHLTRGEHREARFFAEESRQLAVQLGNPDSLLHAAYAQGSSQFCMGELSAAEDSLESMILNHHLPDHRGVFTFGQDPLISCLYFDAITLWLRGDLQRSRARGGEAENLAKNLGHPFTLQWYLTLDVMFCLIRRDYSGANSRIAEAVPICEQYGFEDSLTMLRAQQALGLVLQGKLDASQLAAAPSSGAKAPAGRDIFQTWARGVFAACLAQQGNASFALSALKRAFAVVERTGERFFEAELYRIQGEAALLEGKSTSGSEHNAHLRAEESFLKAIAIARQQGATMFMLRAATSLGRMQQMQRRTVTIASLLREMHQSFPEGSESIDLVEARSFLRSL